MIKVYIESPHDQQNIDYVNLTIQDCLYYGEAPFHHLFYQQITNDIIQQRLLEAKYQWLLVADKVVVYVDYGITTEMQIGIDNAKKLNKSIEYRSLYGLNVDHLC
jgi:hypothetical protein